MPNAARTWTLGLLFFALLCGFDHHHHHHSSGGSHSSGGTVGCGGSSQHPGGSSDGEVPEPPESWRLDGEVVSSGGGAPATASVRVLLMPAGTPVLDAVVTVNGVALAQAEPGTYAGQLPAPAAGSAVQVAASGEHPVQVSGPMPQPAERLCLSGDQLSFTERGHADRLIATELDSRGDRQSASLTTFEEDAQLSVALPPQPGRSEVTVTVELLATGPSGEEGPEGAVRLQDASARLELAR